MIKNYIAIISAFAFSLSALAHPAGHGEVEFIKNKGQWSGDFLYRSNTATGDIYLQQSGFTYVVGRADNAAKLEAFHHGRLKEETTLFFHAYKVHFDGANNASVTHGEEL